MRLNRPRSPLTTATTLALVMLFWGAGRPGAAQSNAATRWRAAIERSDADLQAGRWERVRKKMSRLLDEMTASIESGPGAGWYLGSAAAMRAVAEAGLGNARDAAWDWHMAVTLYPDYETMGLGRYGKGGEALRQALLEFEVRKQVTDDSAEVQPPRKVHAPNPAYPLAKRHACLEESIVVETTISEDGMPFHPRLLTPQYPVMGLATMEALRRWLFEPARLDGEPVCTIFVLTTNFAMQRCSDVARAGRGRRPGGG